MRDRWILPTRSWRIAFWCFAALVFTMTHWPKLRVPGPEGTDLVAHMTAFGTWTMLLGLAALLGERFAARSILLGLAVGAAYAAVDEGLQAIPAIGRTCAWSDYGADVLGVIAGTGVLFVLRGWTMRKAARSASGA